jgi:hypothetical protein
LANELDPSERLAADQLHEQYQRRYGVGVEYLKSQVGPGDEYTNQAARAVISPNGAWFECVDLPMEFSGAAGTEVSYHFVTDPEAMSVLDSLHSIEKDLTDANTRRYSLFAIYERTGIADGRSVYAYQTAFNSDGIERRAQNVGEYRAGELPLAFRARIDTDLEIRNVPFQRGVAFCLTGIGERNLMVLIPYEGTDVRDLGQSPDNPLTQ